MKEPISTEQFIEEATEDFQRTLAKTGDITAQMRFVNLLGAVAHSNFWRGFWVGTGFTGIIVVIFLLIKR